MVAVDGLAGARAMPDAMQAACLREIRTFSAMCAALIVCMILNIIIVLWPGVYAGGSGLDSAMGAYVHSHGEEDDDLLDLWLIGSINGAVNFNTPGIKRMSKWAVGKPRRFSTGP